MPWRTATWWVTQQSTKCTGWAGCCWTANFTFALNGTKKFHLQKTKLNDEIKQLFDNFDKTDLSEPRSTGTRSTGYEQNGIHKLPTKIDHTITMLLDWADANINLLLIKKEIFICMTLGAMCQKTKFRKNFFTFKQD